jgi:hypothetical protein
MLVQDISALAAAQYDVSEGKIIYGVGFHWADMYTHNTKRLLGVTVSIPPMADALMLLLANTLGFLVLTWYLDKTSSADGRPALPPHFFLMPKYWLARRAQRKVDQADAVQHSCVELSELSKSYETGAPCCAHRVDAVKQVTYV